MNFYKYFFKIKDIKLVIETINKGVVAEYFVYWRRKIEKFFWDIKNIYTGMSNKHNVWIIIAEYLRVILLRLSDKI